MGSAPVAGRFWLCPQCRRHVPNRLNHCQCGFDRTESPGAVSEEPVPSSFAAVEDQGRSVTPFLWAGGATVAGALAFWAWSSAESPEEQRERAKRAFQRKQPQVIVIQGPAPTPAAPAPSDHGGPAAERVAADEPIEQPAPIAEAQGAPTPQTEEQRERARAEAIYRPRMVKAAPMVIRADMLLRRYYDACYGRRTVTVREGSSEGGGVEVGASSSRTSGGISYEDRRGRTVGSGSYSGSSEGGWVSSRSWGEDWREVTTMDNASTPECRLIASEIMDLRPKIRQLLEEAERDAVQQNIWTWLQKDVPERLAEQLWRE